MGKRRLLLVALGGLAAALAALPALPALPALSQAGPCPFQIPTPPALRVVGDSYTVRWEDIPQGGIDPGLFSLTWYYTTRRDGADRRRMTTRFRDDFGSGEFRANWKADGPFGYAWTLKEIRRDRNCLVGPPGAGPIISREAMERDSVLSVLVRPASMVPRFAIGLRVQRGDTHYQLRNNGNSLQLLRSGEVLCEQRMPPLRPGEWYWYELGLWNRSKREVVARVRVYDERRERLYASFNYDDRCREPGLNGPGLIALWGPAEFAEVYVDPWEARWADDDANQFRWDTSNVPDGTYYLAAELADCTLKNRPGLVVSDFQVELRRESMALNE